MMIIKNPQKSSFQHGWDQHGWDLSWWIVLIVRDLLAMMKYNLAWRTRLKGSLHGVFYIKRQKARFKVTNCKIVSTLHLILLMLCTCEQEQIESVWTWKWTLSKDGKKNPKPHSLQFQQLGNLTCLTLHYPNTSNAYYIQSHCCLAVQTNLQTVAKYAAKNVQLHWSRKNLQLHIPGRCVCNTPTHAKSKTWIKLWKSLVCTIVLSQQPDNGQSCYMKSMGTVAGVKYCSRTSATEQNLTCSNLQPFHLINTLTLTCQHVYRTSSRLHSLNFIISAYLYREQFQ